MSLPLRRLESLLPPWAKLRVLDTTRPLCEQCADAKVRALRSSPVVLWRRFLWRAPSLSAVPR